MRKILLILAMSLLTVCAVNAQKKTVKYNQYGVAVESDVLDVEAQDGILVLESPKSGYKFWFDVRAQADGAVFFGAPDYADPIGNGTSIRRARFAVKGQMMRLLAQAMKAIGEQNITKEELDGISEILRKYPEKETIKHDLTVMPQWIKNTIQQIIKENKR